MTNPAELATARHLVSRPLAERSPLQFPVPTPAERRERARADAAGIAYLIYRDERGRQRITPLQGSLVQVGRCEEVDVAIPWDPGVSRRHATIRRGSDGRWMVDDGRSTNGTFLNRVRLREPRFLDDHDLLQMGDTPMAFCAGR